MFYGWCCSPQREQSPDSLGAYIRAKEANIKPIKLII